MTFYKYGSFEIPSYMGQGLIDYVEKGVPPGGFLTAVLENDLVGACGKADLNNLKAIPAYAGYLYNKVPSGCWGSPEKVTAWIKAGGLEGTTRAQRIKDAVIATGGVE